MSFVTQEECAVFEWITMWACCCVVPYFGAIEWWSAVCLAYNECAWETVVDVLHFVPETVCFPHSLRHIHIVDFGGVEGGWRCDDVCFFRLALYWKWKTKKRLKMLRESVCRRASAWVHGEGLEILWMFIEKGCIFLLRIIGVWVWFIHFSEKTVNSLPGMEREVRMDGLTWIS